MSKQADKTLHLLALALVFYPTSIEESLHNALRDRLGEKLDKLNKFDQNSFNEIFGYGCPKFIVPIRNMGDFKNMEFDKNIAEPLNLQKEALFEKFIKIQTLNNLSSILKLYSTVPLSKAARLLSVSDSSIREILENYKKRGEIKRRDTPWEKSIIQRWEGRREEEEVKVEGEMIVVKEEGRGGDYSSMWMRQIKKIEEISKELDVF